MRCVREWYGAGGADVSRVSRYVWLTKGNECFRSEDDQWVEYAEEFEEASCAQLDLANTGMTDVVLAALYRYLTTAAKQPNLKHLSEFEGEERVVMALVAELASTAEFVDYGCALRIAWMTEAGEAWCRDYEAWPERVFGSL